MAFLEDQPRLRLLTKEDDYQEIFQGRERLNNKNRLIEKRMQQKEQRNKTADTSHLLEPASTDTLLMETKKRRRG